MAAGAGITSWVLIDYETGTALNSGSHSLPWAADFVEGASENGMCLILTNEESFLAVAYATVVLS